MSTLALKATELGRSLATQNVNKGRRSSLQFYLLATLNTIATVGSLELIELYVFLVESFIYKRVDLEKNEGKEDCFSAIKMCGVTL